MSRACAPPSQNLQNSMMQVSQRIYEAAAGTQQPGGAQAGAQAGGTAGTTAGGGDDVIDAEFKEKIE